MYFREVIGIKVELNNVNVFLKFYNKKITNFKILVCNYTCITCYNYNLDTNCVTCPASTTFRSDSSAPTGGTCPCI